MRPSLGYSNLYWSNKDRKKLEQQKKESEKVINKVETEEVVPEKTEEVEVEEELPPPQPVRFPIARIEK